MRATLLLLPSAPHALVPTPFHSISLSKTLIPNRTLPLTTSSSSRCRHRHRDPPPPVLPFRSKFGSNWRRRNDFSVRSDEGDGDAGGPDDYDVDEEEEVEELDNKKDYDVEYERLMGSDEIEMVQSKSFMSTQGWDSEVVVDYRINEDEFHKIRLMHCDFFIRKPPDPDDDVYDFREMYVTPPDTDVYAIPRVLAPMPQKYIRCALSDFGCYNVTEPPIDAPRDPLYKSEREIYKVIERNYKFQYQPAYQFPGNYYVLVNVFLTKHYRNRRTNDPDFVLDFEEIYAIDSKTKSITRSKVLVTVPGGRNRDRRNDLLIIRDGGNSFKIIDKSKRDDPTTIIEREEWAQSRQDMEKHLRKLRDFSVSNWF